MSDFGSFRQTIAVTFKLSATDCDKIVKELEEKANESVFKNTIENVIIKYYEDFAKKNGYTPTDLDEQPEILVKKILVSKGNNFYDGGLTFEHDESVIFTTMFIDVNVDNISYEYDKSEGFAIADFPFPDADSWREKDNELIQGITDALSKYKIYRIHCLGYEDN